MTPLERARSLAHRLGVGSEEVVPLGQGTEHLAFTAGTYVIRLSDEPNGSAGTAVRREAALLDRLQTRLPVGVPHPALVAVDLGGFAYRRLPGRPLLDLDRTDVTRLIDDLGALLRALVDLTDDDVIGACVDPDPYPLELWQQEAVEDVLRHRPALTTQERHWIRAFARSAVPAEPPLSVLCHNDLGAEHLLVDETSGHLLGVIDWSDAALTDPCRDLGRLTRDLGEAAVQRVVAVAGLAPELRDGGRTVFHARVATLEDLTHGFDTSDRRYVDAARRALPRLFGPLT